MQGGDLFCAIMERLCFKESDTVVAMRNLGHALMYLHNHKIVHRGVSPENLFVSLWCAMLAGMWYVGQFGLLLYIGKCLTSIVFY